VRSDDRKVRVTQAAGVEGPKNLDSHADTCALGCGWQVVEDLGESRTVRPHLGARGVAETMSVVSAATARAHPTNVKVCMLHVQQGRVELLLLAQICQQRHCMHRMSLSRSLGGLSCHSGSPQHGLRALVFHVGRLPLASDSMTWGHAVADELSDFFPVNCLSQLALLFFHWRTDARVLELCARSALLGKSLKLCFPKSTGSLLIQSEHQRNGGFRKNIPHFLGTDWHHDKMRNKR
jgi:hypothetical protein